MTKMEKETKQHFSFIYKIDKCYLRQRCLAKPKSFYQKTLLNQKNVNEAVDNQVEKHQLLPSSHATKQTIIPAKI
jgi:hypothetical protein